MVNVTIYSIHGSYGIGKRKWKPGLLLEESDLPNKNIWKNGGIMGICPEAFGNDRPSEAHRI